MSLLLLTMTVPLQVLSMDQAVNTALQHQPTAQVARAQADAAEARARETRGGLLPSLDLTGRYAWLTNHPGGGIGSGTGLSSSGDSFSADLSAGMLLWDFGQTKDRWESSKAVAGAAAAGARATDQDLVLSVRVAYTDAVEARALIAVAKETLDNEQTHLDQTAQFVQVGTHPAIDLAKLKSQVAQAQAALIATQNAYQLAKARLNLAMGVTGSLDFDVADQSLPALALERETTAQLYQTAVSERPELAGLRLSLQANQLSLSAQKKWLLPALRLGAGIGTSGQDFGDPGWDASVGVTLSWNLFDGLASPAATDAARDQVVVAQAQLSGQELQVWQELESARIGVASAVAQLGAAEQGVTSSRELLDLAEARYKAGVGDSLELADAQLALANAQAEKVRDEHDVTVARAELLRSLGRRSWQ